MRTGFSTRNFDIVMVMDAILISMACLLVILAYREINDAPVRHSQDLAATVMAVSDDLSSEDGWSEIRMDDDGVMQLRRRLAEARKQVARARDNARFSIFSLYPAFASLSERQDSFRTEALSVIKAGQSNFMANETINGVRTIRVASAFLAPADCASCTQTGSKSYTKGEVVGIREVIIPIGDAFAKTVQKLLFACGMLASSLMVFIGIIIPMIKRNRREKALMHTLAATFELQATTDPLTGLHNRRYFEQALKEYLAEFTRTEGPLGLLVFDLDHFKKVNDTHGHDAGDQVLREVALRLKAITRENDVVARIGGEEFAVITPYATHDQLLAVAERYRSMIGALNVHIGKVVLKPTISVGVATNSDGTKSAEDLFKAADKKLYQAKREGRNRVAA